MLKNNLLRLRNFFLTRKKDNSGTSIHYNQVSKVGILINLPDKRHLSRVDAFIKELVNDGKEVKVICFTGNNNCLFDFSFIRLSNNDISWNGNFLSEKINNFIKTDFDYLYSINISPFLPFENILLRSNARFRIGHYFVDGENMFELMLKLGEGEGIDALISMMKDFTKKLKNNEQI